MNAWLPPLYVWLASALAMTLGWALQRHTRNAGIVDAIWAAGMGAAALYYAIVGDGAPLPRALGALLGGFWGCRLCLHLLARVLTEAEDGRYRYLRGHWQDDQRKFFAFFQAQALLTALFSLPFYAVARTPEAPLPLLVAGVAVWCLSVGGESLADWQLARFRRDPRHHGRTCRDGLWRYSRHPNYFFEWTHWFAYLLLSLGSPIAWLAWLGPALMLVSLYWITGIPFVEQQALRSRGEDYRDYQRRTSAFFPWFPKRSAP